MSEHDKILDRVRKLLEQGLRDGKDSPGAIVAPLLTPDAAGSDDGAKDGT